MSPRRLYLDNAATSFPKPITVTEAMVNHTNNLAASSGRGLYGEAQEAGAIVRDARERLNRLFNGENPLHFVFTLNCTDALNLAIKGLIDPNKKSHVICTAIDHNSVLRPINAMAERGWLERTLVPVDPRTGLVDPQEIRKAIRPDTKFIAVTHASNVTGTVQPIREIGAIARECAVPYIVDAAQSAGHVPIDVQADFIDLLAAPGHKGLLGPLGTGFLYLRPGMEKMVRPLREGGTGSKSELAVQPNFMPDRYEPGSYNCIGIVGLVEGLKWIEHRTVAKVHEEEMSLVRTFIESVSDIEGLKYYGPQGVKNRIGVFSMTAPGFTPVELSKELESRYGLLTRPGLHCAPHIHETIGTATSGGACRMSFGPFLTRQDIKFATDCLAELVMQRAESQSR